MYALTTGQKNIWLEANCQLSKALENGCGSPEKPRHGLSGQAWAAPPNHGAQRFKSHACQIRELPHW